MKPKPRPKPANRCPVAASLKFFRHTSIPSKKLYKRSRDKNAKHHQ